MTWRDITYLIPMLMAVICGVWSLLDASRAPDHRRMFRLFMASICWYFAILYGYIYLIDLDQLTSQFADFLRAGYGTRVGVILLFLVLFYDLITYRRNDAR